MTREEIYKEVRRMDPALDADDSAFTGAMILLASAITGPNVRRISRLLGLPQEEVAGRGRKCRESGIWRGNKIAVNWFDEDTGEHSFWLDVCVAEGLVERSALGAGP